MRNLLGTASQMRAMDKAAIEDLGVPGVVLMENAGKGTVDLLVQRFGDPCGKEIIIFAGPGNNGGDGFVIARHLHQLGALLHIVLVAPTEKIGGDAAINFRVVAQLPISMILLLPGVDFTEVASLAGRAFLIVDALLGTGLDRSVEGHYGEVISLINGSNCPVLAVDIPSGLNSDTGQTLGICVQADITASYGLLKLGQVIYPGVDYCGDLHLVDIGIPSQIVQNCGITTELLQKELFGAVCLPRSLNSHKGSFGHVLVVAGSQGKTGAAILATMAALRSGSGLVSVCIPDRLNAIVETSCLEAMTISMGSEWFLTLADYEAVNNAMTGKNAIVLGPGLGVDEGTNLLVERLYCESKLPMVVDADALNNLAQIFGDMSGPPAGVRVLTPHPGEMARMVGLSTKDVQARRTVVASTFAKANDVIVVLKGAATIIAAPDGRIAVNPTGNPTMASGGMGDVLAGVIASFLGQGVSAWEASCLGVYVHGLAADRLVLRNIVSLGVLASEVANELPLALNEVCG